MICVDPLKEGHGLFKQFCHLFTNDSNFEELHDFAQRIGLKRQWFQQEAKYPHYDLTASKRKLAIKFGAKEVGRRYIIKSGNKNRIYADYEIEAGQDWMDGQRGFTKRYIGGDE